MITTQNQTATAQASLDFSDVESTNLLTLYSRAIESRSDDPILSDPYAERIVDLIDQRIADSKEPLLRMLYRKEVDPRLVVHSALRARKYDQYAQEYLARRPCGVVINLGCGMDTRFQRIDDGELRLFDLDLPEVIGLKRRILVESEHYCMIATSVFDYRWMDQVAAAQGGSLLFLAEGLFMYLDPGKVKALVLEIQARFPGSELVCELANRSWIEGWRGKMGAKKMQRQLKIGAGARFTFGVDSPDELESWNPGIEFLEQWSYFDSNHPKLGWMRFLRHLELFRGVQYTVHYRLNPA
jgi:methyltransferase (TIGR00027 family)